jgi:ribosomal protein S27AE
MTWWSQVTEFWLGIVLAVFAVIAVIVVLAARRGQKRGKAVEKKVDFYRTAKCPKCGRFMHKQDNKWVCINPKCQRL